MHPRHGHGQCSLGIIHTWVINYMPELRQVQCQTVDQQFTNPAKTSSIRCPVQSMFRSIEPSPNSLCHVNPPSSWIFTAAVLPAGCTLPVEMFFPPAEYPTEEMEAALMELGVVCRVLPMLSPAEIFGIDSGKLAGGQFIEAHLAGFKMKIAALILSSFQEVSGWVYS